MKIALIAMSGIRVCDAELLRMGLTLPGFVERSKTIASLPSLGLLTLAGLTDSRHDLHYIEIPDLNALDAIPEDIPPLEALAQMALADPMVGSSTDRAQRICTDISRFGAEAVLISRIPGASHCALEGEVISEIVQDKFDIPVLEIEVPPVADSMRPTVHTRLEALVETIKARRTE